MVLVLVLVVVMALCMWLLVDIISTALCFLACRFEFSLSPLTHGNDGFHVAFADLLRVTICNAFFSHNADDAEVEIVLHAVGDIIRID